MHAEVYNVCNLLRNVFKGENKRVGGWPEKCTGRHVPKQIQYMFAAASRWRTHVCPLSSSFTKLMEKATGRIQLTETDYSKAKESKFPQEV